MPNLAAQNPPTILVIDDNPINLRVMLSHLETQGFEIAIAQNGEVGLRLAETTTPDLILLDVMMPGLDGFETCRQLKANPKTTEIPVIFLTVREEIADKLEGFAAGGVDYIIKPFPMEELLARVKVHLTIQALRRELADEHARFQGLSAATFEGVLIHDRGTIVDVNQGWKS